MSLSHGDAIRLDSRLKSCIYNFTDSYIWTGKENVDNLYADENVNVDNLKQIIETLQIVAADCQSLLNRWRELDRAT